MVDWQAGSAPPGSIVDRSSLLARVGGDEALLAELSRLFVQECPDRLHAVRQAVEGHDSERLWRAAHQLCGALALFGAEAAVEAARRLEHMGRNGTLGSARAVCAVLHGETQQLLEELSELSQKICL
jgi:two-component system, sensor histidine kinase and response regulator